MQSFNVRFIFIEDVQWGCKLLQQAFPGLSLSALMFLLSSTIPPNAPQGH